MRRIIAASVSAVALSLVLATSALAMDCVNASKNQAAGVQAVLDSNFEPVWISDGLQQRIDQGVVDVETGEGLHGLIGFDLDDDGDVDASTWVGVGPEGDEIPNQRPGKRPCLSRSDQPLCLPDHVRRNVGKPDVSAHRLADPRQSGLTTPAVPDLRHACATLLFEDGEEFGVVSRILGHSQIATTADVYAHLTPAMLERSGARMDAILAQRSEAASG